MSPWSQEIGATFLDWLALPPALRWLDVGCGTGAFTELLVERCAPAAAEGMDPSEAQLAYARTRVAASAARFRLGDAQALPFLDATFDVAVMPLVLFFVPEPAIGVAEMARVVGPGGTVAAYVWDMPGGGFPYAMVQATLQEAGMAIPVPPHPEVSHCEVLHSLWTDAGLTVVETRPITAQRTFADFDDYWATLLAGPSIGRQLADLSPDAAARVQTHLRERLLAADASGRITTHAWANAVRGRVSAA